MPPSKKSTPKAVALKPLTKRKAWAALKAHHKQIHATNLKKLFAQDAKRAERFTVEEVGIYLDYSKNLITDKTIKLLLELGDPLVGRLLTYDSMDESFRTFKVRRDPACPACGESAGPIVIAEYDDLCMPHPVTV